MHTSVYFREWKPHVTQYEFDKNTIFANVLCVLCVVVWVMYFYRRCRSRKPAKNVKA